MGEKIIIQCVQKQRVYRGELSKPLFYRIMAGLKDGFSSTNRAEISTFFVNNPDIEYIEINLDVNEQKDDPFIVFRNKNQGINTITIKRCHKIIWAYFYTICDLIITGEEISTMKH